MKIRIISKGGNDNVRGNAYGISLPKSIVEHNKLLGKEFNIELSKNGDIIIRLKK